MSSYKKCRHSNKQMLDEQCSLPCQHCQNNRLFETRNLKGRPNFESGLNIGPYHHESPVSLEKEVSIFQRFKV